MITDQEKDLELASKINRETRANPDSRYAGKYIGVLHQQVVVVGDTLAEVEQQLDALGAGPTEGVCLEASADYDQRYTIWFQHACPE